MLWLAGQSFQLAPRAALGWIALSLLSAGLVPVQLLTTKRLIDTLDAHLKAPPVDSSVTALLVVLGVALVLRNLLDSSIPWLQAIVREEVGTSLQARVFVKATRLDLAEFEHEAYHDRITRLLDQVETRPVQVLGRLIGIVSAIPRTAGYAIALALLSPAVLLFTLLTWSLTIARHYRSGQKEHQHRKGLTRTRRLSNYYGMLVTYRDFAKEIRLYGLADYTIGRWRELFWQARNSERRFQIRNNIRDRSSIVLSQVLTLGGLWWFISAQTESAQRVAVLPGPQVAGLATAGAFALLFQSYAGLGNELFALAGDLKRVGDDSGYASELRAFLAAADETDPHASDEVVRTRSGPLLTFPQPMRIGICFEDVWFTYPGADQPALRGVSLTIRPGEKLAIVGVNGAGKSTLTKLLLGLYRPDHGRITIDGVDIQEIEPTSLRSAMSAVLQHFVRYQRTLRENVGISQPSRLGDVERLNEAVRKAGASPIVDRLPHGYDTLLGPDIGGTELSGGEWQRIALARGFFRDAQVLILDEPTAALDPIAELDVFERFVELARDRTALLISHRLGMARLADRLIVIANGRVVEEGTHEELLGKGGEYAELFRAQARWYQ